MKARRDKRRPRCIGVVVFLMAGVLCTSVGAGETAEDPNEAEWDVTDRFAFVWDSVEVSSQIFNPSYTGVRDLYGRQRKLTVVGKVHILDSNDLVGIQVNDPTVLQVTGSDGNAVAWTPLPLHPLRQYQELKREQVWSQHLPPGLELVLQPCDVSISFCVDPGQESQSSLSMLQWSASALYAEDVIAVDVPFEASDDWLEVAPGLQMRVTKATLECCDYVYSTEVKHAGGSVQALDERLSPGESVAEYLVIETLLLDAEGSPIAEYDARTSPAIWSQYVDSTSWSTTQCSGRQNSFFVAQKEIGSIRHIIVVHPREVPVPFIVNDLPLPAF